MPRFHLVGTVALLLLVWAAGTCAERLQVRHDGAPWVVLESDGSVRLQGSQIGSLDDDGTVRNAGGSGIGTVDRDGRLRNASGQIVASVDPDGSLRSSGRLVGSIAPDGTIRLQGRIWGTATPCRSPEARRSVAAILLFFSTFFDSP